MLPNAAIQHKLILHISSIGNKLLILHLNAVFSRPSNPQSPDIPVYARDPYHLFAPVSLQEPSQYHVVLHNDDVTTMEFVVMVLMTIFHKSRPEAFALMMKIHREGSGIAGTYYMDIAKTKAQKTTTLARQNGFPLEVTIQEAI